MSKYTDGVINFDDTSTASTATLSVGNEMQIDFYDTSSAGNASITNNSKGFTAFSNNSSAGTASITNNSGGLTTFTREATGDTATIVNNAGGAVDISQASQGVGIGSLSGAGNVYLGGNNLTMGNLGRNDVIAGTVSDGISPELQSYSTYRNLSFSSGSGGSLTKVGPGTLTLSGINTYTGGTAINGGVVQIDADANLGAASGVLSFEGGTLRTTADVTMDRATTLSAAGGTIETAAGTQLAQGGAMTGAGALTKTGDGALILTADNAYAGGTIISAGTLQLGDGRTSGMIAGDVSNNGTLTFDRSDLSIFAGQISGGGMVRQAGPGTTILNAANTYSGGTDVAGGTLAVGDADHDGAAIGSGMTTVRSGALLGGYGSVLGSVKNSGVLAVANAVPAFGAGGVGKFRITGDLNNAGLVNVAAVSGKIGNVLNVGGNYVGLNGRVVLNTLLNEGGAASHTDMLVVGGTASGNTGIKVNQSGVGALTVGDGIQLVQVKGSSAANSFYLSEPVQVGAYQYLLYQGGAASVNNWYLRSQLDAPTPSPTPPTSTPPTGTPPQSPPTQSPGAAQPIWRPAVVGYRMTSLLNAEYGFAVLGRLHERVGDIASLESGQPGSSNGIWGRVGGQNLEAGAGDRWTTDSTSFLVQFGKDWTLSRDASGGSTHAGATVAFGSSSASFSDNLRGASGQLPNSTGTVEMQSQSIGGYWTRYRPDGAYFDSVAQLTRYWNRYGDVYRGTASQNGLGAGLSGEVGKPYLVGATGIAVEPQVQLLYQYLHLNGFNDSTSPTSSTSTNALRGRAGIRFFAANLDSDTKTGAATPYFTVDVLRNFVSPGRTDVGGTSFTNQLGKTWWDVGLGVTGGLGKSAELYLNVKYSRNLGAGYRYMISGQAGYRYSW
ncbi:autotransporter outer membrane beta-barrel domain-containing protein [Burkholderia cepacia]|uniref:autotransporter family protein n=1 Tax=Burkholderia cepacia TaxID=292 RepID=UPI0018C69260|nr:autotransporter outer membrane beta-barrel domain-containing protein [Burkholderia cepacia]